MEAILTDIDRLIVPALTHWNHPSFFAYFATSTSAPGIFGELLSAAFDVNSMLWRPSPASTELEEVVLDWLRQMLGLDAGLTGFIYDTASVSSMHRDRRRARGRGDAHSRRRHERKKRLAVATCIRFRAGPLFNRQRRLSLSGWAREVCERFR
jgi:Glutamate decarboxylase and related PLP-dependent proteins